LYQRLTQDGADGATPHRAPAGPDDKLALPENLEDPEEPNRMLWDADPLALYKVDIGDAAVRGATYAPVTIVAWGDFQGPAAAAVPTLGRTEPEYGARVGLAWKASPRPFHPPAHMAAALGRAAKAEGRFWRVHELLFEHQQSLDKPDLFRLAAEAGLDTERV